MSSSSISAEFVFHDKDGNILEYTTCKGLEVDHLNIINFRQSDTMNNEQMNWFSKIIHKYLEERYPFALEGTDMEDWKYEPNYNELQRLVDEQNYEELIDYYENEIDRINYFNEETNLWNLWKLLNIQNMMHKYSLIPDTYATFEY
jgi:hypothetical protein